MSEILIRIETAPASDSWGFVGVLKVGPRVAYRTLQSFDTPSEAEDALQDILGVALGELLAGQEWRRVRESTGDAPTRRDLSFGALQPERFALPDD